MTKTAEKTIPFGAAHTYIVDIREYLPGEIYPMKRAMEGLGKANPPLRYPYSQSDIIVLIQPAKTANFFCLYIHTFTLTVLPLKILFGEVVIKVCMYVCVYRFTLGSFRIPLVLPTELNTDVTRKTRRTCSWRD